MTVSALSVVTSCPRVGEAWPFSTVPPPWPGKFQDAVTRNVWAAPWGTLVKVVVQP